MSRNTKLLVAGFAFALAIRLVTLMFVLPKLRPNVDLDSYHSLAKNLAAGRGFFADVPNGHELPSVARTPVYPLFLAGLIRLGGDRLGLFLAAQCVLGALTCVLTVILAARWLRPVASLLAGLLVAIDPNSVLRCSDLRTETLFTLLIVAGICLLVWYPDRAWSWFANGLCWSLAALTRPIAIWIWLVALLILALGGAGSLGFDLSSIALATEEASSRSRLPPANLCRDKFRRSACFFSIFLIGYVPLEGVWMARNYRLTGHCFISSISTYNLMFRAAGIKAAQQGQAQEDAEQEFVARYGNIQFVESRERFNQSLREYQRVIAEELFSAPGILVKQAAVGCGKLLLGPGVRALDNSLSQTEPPAKWWPPIYSAALLVVLFLSLVGVRRLGWEAIVPALLILYFVGLSSGPESNSRFRVPITPLLAVLATAGACGTEKRE